VRPFARAFISLEELCKAANVDVEILKTFGTRPWNPAALPSYLADFPKLFDALKKLGLHSRRSSACGSAIGGLEAIGQANGSGVLVVSIEYGKMGLVRRGNWWEVGQR